MAGHHLAAPGDMEASDSRSSTPRSDYHHLLHDDGDAAAIQPRVRFMCSFGGKIVPRPHDNQLRYVGGDTRIVAVQRHHTTFSSLLSKLSKLSGTTNISIKYQLPNEDLDALITVTCDEDVENMMEEYDRLTLSHKSTRLRIFLFPTTDIGDSRSSSISSLLDGSAKRENWFVDALNGGPASGAILERGRSEVSSIVSEVPDYLFGLDRSDDALKESNYNFESKNLLSDNVSMSDPGSPALVAQSPFCSTSSSLAPAPPGMIPHLPPVKTRPANPIQHMGHKETGLVSMKTTSQPTGYSSGPIYHYPNPQPVQPVYYVPTDSHAPVQPLQIQPQFVQPYSVALASAQLPLGYPGPNQVYGAGMRPSEFPVRILTDNAGQVMYYGARNTAVVPGSYPGMVVPGGEELHMSGPDVIPGRISPGP